MDRVQEFRKCIECFLCQNVCHVVRDHHKKEEFGGPRFFVRVASLEMHPLDNVSRVKLLKTNWASAIAISPNAALKFARKKSTSPTMPSFRSKSAWWMNITIPS